MQNFDTVCHCPVPFPQTRSSWTRWQTCSNPWRPCSGVAAALRTTGRKRPRRTGGRSCFPATVAATRIAAPASSASRTVSSAKNVSELCIYSETGFQYGVERKFVCLRRRRNCRSFSPFYTLQSAVGWFSMKHLLFHWDWQKILVKKRQNLPRIKMF